MQPSAEDIELARARAAKDLVNIDSDERRRRVIFGSIVTVGLPLMHLGTSIQSVSHTYTVFCMHQPLCQACTKLLCLLATLLLRTACGCLLGVAQ